MEKKTQTTAKSSAQILTNQKKPTAKTFSKIKLHTLLYDLTSDEYHSASGSFSSTQIKDLLGDEEYFYKKHILKEIARERIGAFDVGTYFHTGVLEPHKLEAECIVYNGKVRRGEHWDAFCAKHVGKAIVTKKDQSSAEGLIAAVKKSSIAVKALEKGSPEVSMFVELIVHSGVIYSENIMSYLGPHGWEKCDFVPINARKIIIKVRADFLGQGYVLDLKSTTGDAKDAHTVKTKVSAYNYDLSAALYLDMFTAGTGKSYKQFLWVFASKDYFNCKTWVASDLNIEIGRAKWSKAIIKLARGLDSNWAFEETIGVLEPNFFEREHLIEDDSNLL